MSLLDGAQIKLDLLWLPATFPGPGLPIEDSGYESAMVALIAVGPSIQFSQDRLLPGVDIEIPGTGTGAVRDSSVEIDEVELRRRGRVGFADLVGDGIEEDGERNVEAGDASPRDCGPLVIGGRLVEDDAFSPVHLHLPAVVGMSFLNIDEVELNSFPVTPADLGDSGKRSSKGATCVRAEDECDRSDSSEV